MVILADGMGGHRAGNIASEMTVTDLGREWINTDYTELSQIRDWLLVTLEAENRKVYELGQTDEYKGMGTTVEWQLLITMSSMLTLGIHALVCSTKENTNCCTSDHSLVNELVKAGQLTEEEAANHPQKISLHSLLDKQILLSQI